MTKKIKVIELKDLKVNIFKKIIYRLKYRKLIKKMLDNTTIFIPNHCDICWYEDGE